MARVDEVIGYGLHDDRPAAGSAGRLYYETDTEQIFRDNGTTWDELVLTGGGGGSLTTLVSVMASDVTMTTANTFYDGVSITCSAGTWLLIGIATCRGSGSDYTAKIWDGTTDYSSSNTGRAGIAGGTVTLPVCAVVTPTGTTTYKLSCTCADNGQVFAAAVFTNPAGNTATQLIGLKVA